MLLVRRLLQDPVAPIIYLTFEGEQPDGEVEESPFFEIRKSEQPELFAYLEARGTAASGRPNA